MSFNGGKDCELLRVFRVTRFLKSARHRPYSPSRRGALPPASITRHSRSALSNAHSSALHHCAPALLRA